MIPSSAWLVPAGHRLARGDLFACRGGGRIVILGSLYGRDIDLTSVPEPGSIAAVLYLQVTGGGGPVIGACLRASPRNGQFKGVCLERYVHFFENGALERDFEWGAVENTRPGGEAALPTLLRQESLLGPLEALMGEYASDFMALDVRRSWRRRARNLVHELDYLQRIHDGLIETHTLAERLGIDDASVPKVYADAICAGRDYIAAWRLLESKLRANVRDASFVSLLSGLIDSRTPAPSAVDLVLESWETTERVFA